MIHLLNAEGGAADTPTKGRGGRSRTTESRKGLAAPVAVFARLARRPLAKGAQRTAARGRGRPARWGGRPGVPAEEVPYLSGAVDVLAADRSEGGS